MRRFPERLPAMLDEVAGWLGERGLVPSSPPFLRYHVVDMPERMDVEAGFPLDAAPADAGSLPRGVLPAGRYAVLTYTGVAEGVAANARLKDWIAAQGEAIDSRLTPDGEAFAARLEAFLTDPETEPDQRRWRTEAAFKLRDR